MQRVFATMMTLALGLLLSTAPTLGAQAAVSPETVRHIVVFKYKPGATEEQIKQVTDAFVALKTKIPNIVSIEHGVNNSPEKHNQGFTHVYQVTFTNAAARDAYLPHPAHKAFGELLGKLGVLEDVFVVDYTPARD
jgi:hypothetical protein